MSNDYTKRVPALIESGAGAARAPDRLRDPISVVIDTVSDDPSLSELIGFRDSIPDLKAAVREAKRCFDEAMRRYGTDLADPMSPLATAALKLVALCCTALVCIWPSDTLNEVEAKLALAATTGLNSDDQKRDYVPSLDPPTATRIRIKRAAFNVGELMAPVAPPPPTATDRNLANWPLASVDLTTMLPPRGGEPTLGADELARWAALLDAAPNLDQLTDRAEQLIKVSDRLFALADRDRESPRDLRRAAEGALILAYLTAAQVAIWPVAKGTSGVGAKRRLAKLIDGRACRGDPAHMQAAIRHLFTEASRIARTLYARRVAVVLPTWIEIV